MKKSAQIKNQFNGISLRYFPSANELYGLQKRTNARGKWQKKVLPRYRTIANNYHLSMLYASYRHTAEAKMRKYYDGKCVYCERIMWI